MKKSRLILTAAAAVIAAVFPFACSTALSASYYTINSPEITKSVKLAFISDLHNSEYGRDMCEITGMVDSFAPDIVIFGGDLFDDYGSTENSLTLAEELSARYPCYYSLGNHEYRRSDRTQLTEAVTKLGVNVMSGDSADIGGNIRVIGIDSYDHVGYAREEASDDTFDLLIYHYPEDFGLFSGSGADLILCGHAHGGQIRIPFTGQGIYSPNQGLFPEYTSGLYSENGTDMIVSRGLCRSLPFAVIPRVFNRPEVVFITLGEAAE